MFLQPVYFPIAKHDLNDLEKSEESQLESFLKITLPEDKNEVEVNGKRRKRRSKEKMTEGDVREIIRRPRILRTRVKKWYAENDDDEKVKEGSSSNKG